MQKECENDQDLILYNDEDDSNKCLNYSFLQILMLTPILWVIGLLWYLHSLILTQLAFQLITLIGLPYIYLRIYQINPRKYMNFKDLRQQVYIGLGLLTFSFLGLGITLFLLCQFTDIIDFTLIHQLGSNKVSMVFACLLLGISNPFFEEFFWRIFTKIIIKNNSEFIKWYLAFNYALYHFFVLYLLVNQYYWAIIGFLCIWIGGRVFILINERMGYMCCSLFHMGADLGVISVGLYYIMIE